MRLKEYKETTGTFFFHKQRFIQIMAWIHKYISGLMQVEYKVWLGNYMPLFYMDAIIYSCPNTETEHKVSL